MKKEIFIPILSNRQNSFWFCDEYLAAQFSKNDRYIRIVVIGEIFVTFPNSENKHYKNSQAVYFAMRNEYTDDTLSELFEKELFEYSNWFQPIFRKGENGKWKELCDSPIYSTINEFLFTLEEFMNDDKLWKDLDKFCC